MTIPEQIVDFLRLNAPKAYCDDCLSETLGLARRQEAHQATSALGASGAFARDSGRCSHCDKQKLVTRVK